MADLLALLAGGKPKGKPSMGMGDKSMDMGGKSEGGGPEETYAREAFDALKDDDVEGFVSAFLSAVRACSKKDYAEPDNDDAEE